MMHLECPSLLLELEFFSPFLLLQQSQYVVLRKRCRSQHTSSLSLNFWASSSLFSFSSILLFAPCCAISGVPPGRWESLHTSAFSLVFFSSSSCPTSLRFYGGVRLVLRRMRWGSKRALRFSSSSPASCSFFSGSSSFRLCSS